MSGNLRGILWMLLALPCFQVMNAMLRFVSGDLPVIEVLFFRTSFGFLVLLPWLLRAGGGALRLSRPLPHFLRAAVHTGGMWLWVFALTQIPMASATALQFTSPLFVAIGAVLIMGERSDWRRWLAVVIGFAGTLIIVRPGAETFDIGAAAVIGAAVLLAASKMLTKVTTRTSSTFAVVFYFNLLMALCALGPALMVWQWPEPEHYLWFTAMAFVGALAHIALTRGIAGADLTILQPFEFSGLIWAAIIGFTIFGEVPQWWIFLGGGVIMLGATIVVRAERRPAPAAEVRPSPAP